ncbi:hypothetical protein [Compostimonas suwonensis]|uniref:hypothetical protein n=1 Tax=Compostimonas suwonensis TaxID=1048394 RepID=UPI0012FDAE08|nr:hypothetical protein [Compostimonas suwonensis]
MSEKTHRATRRKVTVLTLATFLLLGTSLPAYADEAAPQSGETSLEALLSVVGYDAEVAASHGYELRVDDQGREVSVPISNAPGD